MRYQVKIKLRVNSTMTTTTVEINAVNANIAKAIALGQYGAGSVLSVTKKASH